MYYVYSAGSNVCILQMRTLEDPCHGCEQLVCECMGVSIYVMSPHV